MTNKLLSKPTLIGMMRESPNYRAMGNGLTDTVLIIGHADAAVMYEPYQVIDIREAVNFLNADIQSPVMKSLLELYNAGCRDIWIYAAAPMSEYNTSISDRLISKVELGNKTFYEKWYDRLTDAYSALSDWDFMDIVVPVEAVFYDAGGVDFATQLISFCTTTFADTGNVMLGVLGTRIVTPGPEAIATMAADVRIPSFSEDGKFVLVVVGEGIVNNQQISNSYVAPLATQVAALISTADLNRSIAGLKLPNCSSVAGPDYTADQLEALTQAKLNPVVRSKKGKRGYAFESKLLTDNTLGKDGTDFWSMAQMHIVANCINKVRSLGYAFIGETQTDQFQKAVYDYLRKLTDNEYIKDFSLNIDITERGSKAAVTIGIVPIFGIRNIYFTTIVGPGV